MERHFARLQNTFNLTSRFIRVEAIVFAMLLILLCTNLAYLKTTSGSIISINGAAMVFDSIHASETNNPLFVPGIYIWLLLAVIVTFTGVLQAIITVNRKGYGFLLSMAGIISQLMLQISLGLYMKNVSINYSQTYWISLMLFALAGSISYLTRQNNALPLPDSKNKALHINIITTANKESPELETGKKSSGGRKK